MACHAIEASSTLAGTAKFLKPHRLDTSLSNETLGPATVVSPFYAGFVYRLGHRPFTLIRRVRFPYPVPNPVTIFDKMALD